MNVLLCIALLVASSAAQVRFTRVALHSSGTGAIITFTNLGTTAVDTTDYVIRSDRQVSNINPAKQPQNVQRVSGSGPVIEPGASWTLNFKGWVTPPLAGVLSQSSDIALYASRGTYTSITILDFVQYCRGAASPGCPNYGDYLAATNSNPARWTIDTWVRYPTAQVGANLTFIGGANDRGRNFWLPAPIVPPTGAPTFFSGDNCCCYRDGEPGCTVEVVVVCGLSGGTCGSLAPTTAPPSTTGLATAVPTSAPGATTLATSSTSSTSSTAQTTTVDRGLGTTVAPVGTTVAPVGTTVAGTSADGTSADGTTVSTTVTPTTLAPTTLAPTTGAPTTAAPTTAAPTTAAPTTLAPTMNTQVGGTFAPTTLAPTTAAPTTAAPTTAAPTTQAPTTQSPTAPVTTTTAATTTAAPTASASSLGASVAMLLLLALVVV